MKEGRNTREQNEGRGEGKASCVLALSHNKHTITIVAIYYNIQNDIQREG